jgi:hypothetical protein
VGAHEREAPIDATSETSEIRRKLRQTCSQRDNDPVEELPATAKSVNRTALNAAQLTF